MQTSGKENVPPTTQGSGSAKEVLAANLPKEAPKPAPKNTKKRKSDAVEDNQELFPKDLPEVDFEDLIAPAETCNAIRRKIRTWIESGAMKVGEFQKELGVSSASYLNFMRRTQTWDGQGCETYVRATLFFRKREVLGLPLKANKPKKPKTAASAAKVSELLDVSGIELDDEDEGRVPVYDTCDEIRKKIRALLAKDGVTQAAFVRELSKLSWDEQKVSTASLKYFMGQKGVRSGNTSRVFYTAYVFFEKRRIKTSKPRSAFREEMEEAHWPMSMDIENGSNVAYVFSVNSRPYIDEYGRIRVM